MYFIHQVDNNLSYVVSVLLSSILLAWYCEGRKLNFRSEVLVSRILLISAVSFDFFSIS